MAGPEPVAESFASATAWERWLGRNHERQEGLWIRFAKKGTGVKSVSYAEAVHVALAYGWIDGQSKGLDDTYYLQRFTPRRARSNWSKLNRAAAERMLAAGEMKPSGLREVERAKADGRWEAAYDSARTATVPHDLKRELDRNPKAKETFEGLARSYRYTILYGLQDAKRPETRERRLAKFVALLNAGEKPN